MKWLSHFEKCIDCGQKIHAISTRCKKCSAKIKGQKLRKVIRPILAQLKQDIINLGYVGTGKKYGVSDNAIRKWIKGV